MISYVWMKIITRKLSNIMSAFHLLIVTYKKHWGTKINCFEAWETGWDMVKG